MKQRKQNSKPPNSLACGGRLLLIVIAIMLSSQNTSTVPTPVPLSEEEADAAVPRVSLDDAKAALDSNSAFANKSVAGYSENH